jgi:hypothetical protein
MTAIVNPALEAFVAEMGLELILAQVLISTSGCGFELRHVEDRQRAAADLKLVTTTELRKLAQVTGTGDFRPLKSAPNLQTGWRLVAGDTDELDFALQQLYPNAIADWFAARQPAPPITHYREFTNRQTGMYRITQHLTDSQAADVIRGCCERRLCLKRRLWSVAGLAADSLGAKSLIPCLEPCALLLESARKAARVGQSGSLPTEKIQNAQLPTTNY